MPLDGGEDDKFDDDEKKLPSKYKIEPWEAQRPRKKREGHKDERVRLKGRPQPHPTVKDITFDTPRLTDLKRVAALDVLVYHRGDPPGAEQMEGLSPDDQTKMVKQAKRNRRLWAKEPWYGGYKKVADARVRRVLTVKERERWEHAKGYGDTRLAKGYVLCSNGFWLPREKAETEFAAEQLRPWESAWWRIPYIRNPGGGRLLSRLGKTEEELDRLKAKAKAKKAKKKAARAVQEKRADAAKEAHRKVKESEAAKALAEGREVDEPKTTEGLVAEWFASCPEATAEFPEIADAADNGQDLKAAQDRWDTKGPLAYLPGGKKHRGIDTGTMFAVGGKSGAPASWGCKHDVADRAEWDAKHGVWRSTEVVPDERPNTDGAERVAIEPIGIRTHEAGELGWHRDHDDETGKPVGEAARIQTTKQVFREVRVHASLFQLQAEAQRLGLYGPGERPGLYGQFSWVEDEWRDEVARQVEALRAGEAGYRAREHGRLTGGHGSLRGALAGRFDDIRTMVTPHDLRDFKGLNRWPWWRRAAIKLLLRNNPDESDLLTKLAKARARLLAGRGTG